MKIIKLLFFTLVLIGALNWGLVGLFEVDLVAKLFGAMSLISRIVYSLVGLSAFIAAVTVYPIIMKED